MPPLLAGTLASLLVTWVTFVPCFLWVFLGAPYMEAMRGSRALSGALSCITAAVVGVILNLAVWFALHTLFRDIEPLHWNGLRLWSIQWNSVSWPSVAIALLAVFLLLGLRLGMLPVLGICAAAGLVVRLTGGGV
jgi:chromate transporter